MRETIGEVTLNLDCYEGQDGYSDGDVEEELLELVKQYPPEEFPRLIRERASWPVLYHLSEQRTAIIDWYPFKEDASVLEIGAGCGAITGALIGRAKRVVANDLSKRRSLINAYRHREAKNLELLVGNFQSVAEHLQEKFDYITLIGVLEYAGSYIEGKDPWKEFLTAVSGLLKDGGEVLIAIENRLGLKYFAGCREDHTGRAFEGIEGYPNGGGVRTFSREELKNLLCAAGFSDLEFYYPYPDYKFPTAIYSDSYLPRKGELFQNLRNFDSDRYVFFDEGKAFDTILESGYFPIFSNSFFVRAKK